MRKNIWVLLVVTAILGWALAFHMFEAGIHEGERRCQEGLRHRLEDREAVYMFTSDGKGVTRSRLITLDGTAVIEDLNSPGKLP